MESDEQQSRRYVILGVLGSGGFGTVYHARLMGPMNFRKDVAIKLLRKDASPQFIQRFRDEARILGLLRDNAVTVAEPPTRLNGRWAIVMEYVDGASLATILRRGALPVSIALAIVREVARALHHVWHHRGLEGPMRLIHRDIKPANIHVTPHGDVKILDFGIAKAEFEHREAVTVDFVAGTAGFIAPERFHGVDRPAGDVFSLGVVLHELLTGALPAPYGQFDWKSTADSPEMHDALRLAAWMREPDPDERPSADDVERLCASLLREHGGEWLRDWAEHAVSDVKMCPPDQLVGAVFTESQSAIPEPPEDVPEPIRQPSSKSST